jgi:hypothetical protein
MFETLTEDTLKHLLLMRKRRFVAGALVLSLIFAGFEASTQMVSLWLLNQRIETTSRLLSDASVSSARKLELVQIQDANAAELKRINVVLAEPGSFFAGQFIRFAKGFWPSFIGALLLLYVGTKIWRRMPEEHRKLQGGLQILFMGWSVLFLFGVANGLISVYWNRSEQFFISVFVFPSVSAVFLAAFLCLWVFIEDTSKT